ncbi:hypothetical protein [Rhodovibrio salinarum]|nr:hypothetical protein [Rhodovibrio salinarum]
MTTRTAITRDHLKQSSHTGAFKRLRNSLAGGKRFERRTTAARQTNTVLHDVAFGGTVGSAVDNVLRTMATSRRG